MSTQRHTSDADTLQNQANALQKSATEPNLPVWVGASAGSGKTRVLVNRLLRLILPSKGRQESAPHQILCITFTKAGAAEVMDRIVSKLRGWTIADDEDKLRADLEDLLEEEISEKQLRDARALFARVIESPGGMKIMTIHAFCESVLHKFPMEAGLTPGFEVMEESESRETLRDIRRALITRLQDDKPEDKALKAAFDHLSTIRNAEQIESLMERMMSERGRLRTMLTAHGDIAGLTAAVEKTLSVPANASEDTIIAGFCTRIPDDDLRAMLPVIENGLSDDKSWHPKLANMLSLPMIDRATAWDAYKSIFLTDGGTIRTFSKSVLKREDAHAATFIAEANRVLQVDSDLRDFYTAQSTNALLRFSVAILEAYEDEKRKISRLDFEDLIDRTKRLLGGTGVNWVQYKLDGGIDHILVDEAQDTNPDQWDIITALYDEFYAGNGMREDKTRTTFVVGDEKQSIFSFQRADPRVFAQMHDRLDCVTDERQRTIPMQISFRSSPSILKMVDAVFEPEDMRVGVLQNPAEPMHHYARKTGKAGRVELWPLIKKPATPPREAWSLPLRAETGEKDPVAQMADLVAQKIHTLLTDPAEELKSHGRHIRPGDIMILLSKRKPLAEAILKSLRQYKIPVSGIDRMVVTRQLAVQDVLAAIVFVLQPDDDLNLAALLKSPFIGMDEQTLFDRAHNRGSRPLWQAVKEADGKTGDWLSGLLSFTGTVSAFLHHVLYTSCPADARSGMRALLQRLGEDVRDPLQELLARADHYDLQDVRGLQGFLQDALLDDSEIKRDMQEGGGRVRLMTVHGSKGLEAPVVFLPDTVRATASRNLKDPILWPARNDTHGVPLWSRNSESAAALYSERASNLKERGDEEQRRLLYVALTRAADRLYIGGMQKSEDRYIDKNNSWYFKCEAAMQAAGQAEGDVLVIEKQRQTDPLEKDKHADTGTTADITPEKWMFEDAPAPEVPPRPLMPSKPESDDPAVMSPLYGDISYRYQRGRLIHTLFQFLPDLPLEDRFPRAATWLAQPGHKLTMGAQNEILEAIFNVLDDPAFAHLFTSDARAEVSITGHLKTPSGTHTIVSGQVDRLLVEDTQVTVLDYKTNRPAPKTLEDVPAAYKKQLRTYRDILAEIWPGRTIRTALIWTDGPALMDLTDAL